MNEKHAKTKQKYKIGCRQMEKELDAMNERGTANRNFRLVFFFIVSVRSLLLVVFFFLKSLLPCGTSIVFRMAQTERKPLVI